VVVLTDLVAFSCSKNKLSLITLEIAKIAVLSERLQARKQDVVNNRGEKLTPCQQSIKHDG
jgi:hypothetical protein